MASNGAAIVQAPPGLDFTAEQRQLIRDTYANGATDSEFGILMEVAKARGLSPLKRQIWFVKRWDGQKKREVWGPMVSIDGLRGIAERSGQYDGQDEPEFSYDKAGKLHSCKVRVYRKGISRAFCTPAIFSEYVQLAKDKESGQWRPNAMWQKSPHVMLAKCAEALSLRKAFPEDTADMLVPEELEPTPEQDIAPVSTTNHVEVVKDQLLARLGGKLTIKDAEIPEEPPAEFEPVALQEPATPAPAKVVELKKPGTVEERRNALAEKAKTVTTREGFAQWRLSVLNRDVPWSKLTADDLTTLETEFEALTSVPEPSKDDVPF